MKNVKILGVFLILFSFTLVSANSSNYGETLDLQRTSVTLNYDEEMEFNPCTDLCYVSYGQCLWWASNRLQRAACAAAYTACLAGCYIGAEL